MLIIVIQTKNQKNISLGMMVLVMLLTNTLSRKLSRQWKVKVKKIFYMIHISKNLRKTETFVVARVSTVGIILQHLRMKSFVICMNYVHIGNQKCTSTLVREY